MGWAGALKSTLIACKMIEIAKLDGVEPPSWLTKFFAAFLFIIREFNPNTTIIESSSKVYVGDPLII